MLRVPTVMMGFALPDSNLHAPDENLHLPTFFRGIRTSIRFPARDGEARCVMIIDCHCHAGTGDGLTGPWDTAAPLGRHLRRAARAGIDRTVIFAAFHSDYAVANREVARMVASRPDRLYGFAFVHADRDRGRVHELVRVAVQEYGFVGHQGASPRRADHARSVRGGPRVRVSRCSTT